MGKWFCQQSKNACRDRHQKSHKQGTIFYLKINNGYLKRGEPKGQSLSGRYPLYTSSSKLLLSSSKGLYNTQNSKNILSFIESYKQFSLAFSLVVAATPSRRNNGRLSSTEKSSKYHQDKVSKYHQDESI